jgi:hypothetical protein
MGKKEASDTTVPLEWDCACEAWYVPLLDHDWAELRGLLLRDASGVQRIADEDYQLERSPEGRHRVLWTAQGVARPDQVYALVAVRPKEPGTVRGIPLALVTPVVTAIAGALAALLVGAPNKSESKLGPEVAECRSASEELQRRNGELQQINSDLQQKLAGLEPYRSAHEDEVEFVLKRPNRDRILYLMGESHGLRLEALRNILKQDSLARDIALQAEENYVSSALAKETNALAFTQGKTRGQKDAVRLLGLGELTILSGSDTQEFR